MRKIFEWGCRLSLSVLVLLPSWPQAPGSDEPPVLARVDFSSISPLQALPVYALLQDGQGFEYALVMADRKQLEKSGIPFRVLDRETQNGHYLLATRRRPNPSKRIPNGAGTVLQDDGRQSLIKLAKEPADSLIEQGFEIRWLRHPLILRAPVVTAVTESFTINPLVTTMIEQVQQSTLTAYVGRLSGETVANIGGAAYTLETRCTTSGVPIQKATQFIYEHVQGLGLHAGYHNWSLGGISNRNVIGELPGLRMPNEIVVVSAHLDDLPFVGRAPGADDNASGSAGVLLMADILSAYRFDRTLRFIWFTGEEQGLLGSGEYAQQAAQKGEQLVAIYNLDMVAYDTINGPTLQLHTRTATDPGYSGDRAIADLFVNVTGNYVLGSSLTPLITSSGESGSDHSSFWNFGYSAILAIEDDQNDFNPYYHSSADTLQNLNGAYFTSFIQASVATAAHLAIPNTWTNQIFLPLLIKP